MERKEAMEIVRKLYKDSLFLKKDKEAIVTLIPELKESEDEKIRKELIEHIKANCETDFILFQKFSPDDIITWLENPTGNDIKEALRTEYEKGRADAIAEMQKPVNIDYISGIRKELLGIEDNAKNINGLTESQWVAIRAAHRLLGEYMAKEQNHAWSEEDEFMATAVENSFYLHCGQMTDRLSEQYKKFFKKVKSFRPQSTWKPSDEQIEILDMVLTNKSMDDNIARILQELREQLKKLRGK